MSALIYAAIVAMWAYFLVPMWLRRPDMTPCDPSSDRVSGGERVLPRRVTHTPHDRSHERPPVMASNPRDRRPADDPGPADDRRTLGACDRRLALRRWVLLGLLLAQVFTVAVGLAGVVPAWTGLLVLVPLAAYVTHLRAEARRGADRGPSRQPLPEPAISPAAPTPAAPPARRGGISSEPQLFDLAAIEAAEAAARAAKRPPAPATWDPVPVPPPTYIIKSRSPIAPSADPRSSGATRRRKGGGAQRAVND